MPDAPAPVVDDALPASWVLLETHSDEFDAAALDQSKWQVDLPDWGTWSWRSQNVGVSGGNLLLTMAAETHERDGRQLHYTAGIVRSRAAPIRYGYVEARIRAAGRWPGVASAFWLFRNRPDYWTEIDVVEMMQRRNTRRIIDVSLYVLRDPAIQQLPVRIKQHADVDWDPAEDFHVYSCLWDAGRVRHYVDGRLVLESPNEHWHQPLDVVLSLGLRSPLDTTPDPDGFPTRMAVDYVRVWGPPIQ